MHAVVIYDSQFGNTEQIARAIARGLAEHGVAQVLKTTEAGRRAPDPTDLLVVGGPTQRHGMSPALRTFVGDQKRHSLDHVPVATFDTRYRMATMLSGSAAHQAAARLRRAGCHVIATPESFFIARGRPADGAKGDHSVERLEPGELDRATEWGRGLAAVATLA